MNGQTHRRFVLLFFVLILFVFTLVACLDYDSGKQTGEALRDFSDSTGEFLSGVKDGYGGTTCPAGVAPGMVLVIGLGMQTWRKR
jgi:hypothetical protein